jgi:hypothetical protein
MQEIYIEHPYLMLLVSNLGNCKYLDGTPATIYKGIYTSVLVAAKNTGVVKQLSIHRVVAEAFHGPIPKGYVVNHLDCNKHNNAASNLQICTPSENAHHAILNGRVSIKTGADRSDKFTEEDVLYIYSRFKEGCSNEELALKYKVNFRTISQLRLGTRWSAFYSEHLNQYYPPKSMGPLTDEQVKEIQELSAKGFTNKTIAELFSIDPSTVSRIKNKKLYKSVCATTIENTSNDGSE